MEILEQIDNILSIFTPSKSNVLGVDTDPYHEQDNGSPAQGITVFIEDIPSVMISKVASYLNQNDYFRFMHLSRRILIGCHSPFSLYHLYVYDHPKQYSAAHSLRPVVNPRFPEITDGRFDALKAATSMFSNQNIKKLTIIHRNGGQLDQRNKFLRFISGSPNIKCLDIPIYIPLHIDGKKQKLPTMPALKGSDYHFGCDIFAELQRSLIRKHVMQMESLKVDMALVREISAMPPKFTLCNLTELKVENGAYMVSRKVLFEWILQSSKLKMFSFDYSDYPIAMKSYVSDLITFLIENQPNLQFTELRYDAVHGNVMRFMQQIGDGLSKSNLKEKGKVNEDMEFKLRLRFEGGDETLEQRATQRLVECSRDGGPITISQLKKEFNRPQFLSWYHGFRNEFGDFTSFVRNHDRFYFEIADCWGHEATAELLEGSGDAIESETVQKSKGMKTAKKIINELGYLLQILEGCNVRHFMVQIVVRLRGFMRISRQQNAEMMKSELNGMLPKWKEEYRVDLFYESKWQLEDDRWRITFCNKDNPMKGGYGARGLFIE